jgi:hypothetical protein
LEKGWGGQETQLDPIVSLLGALLSRLAGGRVSLFIQFLFIEFFHQYLAIHISVSSISYHLILFIEFFHQYLAIHKNARPNFSFRFYNVRFSASSPGVPWPTSRG